MGFDAVVEVGGATGLAQVLTVEEVADLMRVDRKTAYAAIADGGVPGVRRIGRCIRVSHRNYADWGSHRHLAHLRWIRSADPTWIS